FRTHSAGIEDRAELVVHREKEGNETPGRARGLDFVSVLSTLYCFCKRCHNFAGREDLPAQIVRQRLTRREGLRRRALRASRSVTGEDGGGHADSNRQADFRGAAS